MLQRIPQYSESGHSAAVQYRSRWATSNKLVTVALMSAFPESDHQPPHGIPPLWAIYDHFALRKTASLLADAR
jgi:hypothetical protein